MPDTPGRKDDPDSPKSLDKSGSDLPDRLSDLKSLRNEDGSPGPLATAMKEQDSSPGSAPDLTSKAWREALPGLQKDWKQHLERWPETEHPSVDRPSPEPGSWRGDGGQYLNTEENIAAERSLDRVSKVEDSVTASVKDVEAEVPGALLVGLEYRLKGEDRFKEKFSYEIRGKPEQTIGQIANNMPDTIRYTYQFDADSYTEGYKVTCDKLREHGNEMEYCRNSWGNPQYRGVNTAWRDPSGQLFEVQFHTPDSFSAKQLTHPAFERLRAPRTVTSGPERGELEKFQQKVTAAIPQPAGALSISNYRKRD